MSCLLALTYIGAGYFAYYNFLKVDASPKTNTSRWRVRAQTYVPISVSLSVTVGMTISLTFLLV